MKSWLKLGRFIREDGGNVTVFSVFMLVLIIAITGASVDIMRFEAVRAKMQSTMDRAVLAAADLDQKQDPIAVVNDYMDKAGLSEVLSDVTVEQGDNYRTVTASGRGTMDTIFLHMSGFDTMTAPARSAAEEKIANVEISLVLDISGSMRFNNRMDQMKPAAQAFVNKVMTDNTNGVTTLSLVPFAGQVNPGDILFDYFRGERPKIKHENNGWGNGDQDAPGNSLCNNNAENAEEGSLDPFCSGDASTDAQTWKEAGFFSDWDKDIASVVFYFDINGDEIYDVAHKIENFASSMRDVDDMFKGAVAYLVNADGDLTSGQQFLGASIKGVSGKALYFQVKGDENGHAADLGPTKNKGKLPGDTFSYGSIDYGYWAQFYDGETVETREAAAKEAEAEQTNINMPGSCIEVYSDEFATTAMPTSDDYVPHFVHWPIDTEVMDWGWCPGEDTAVQYYSSDRQHLVDFIGNMRMHDGTGLHYGMKYGLALLDPENQDEMTHLIANGVVDPRFQGRPIAWNDPETEKFLVVMTDGQTTEQYRPTKPRDAINGSVPLSEQGSDSYSLLAPASTNISLLRQQCDVARARGVTVFAIAYETDDAGSADMKYCASSPSHFFHVQGDGIDDAFDTVARQINNLRLIQ